MTEIMAAKLRERVLTRAYKDEPLSFADITLFPSESRYDGEIFEREIFLRGLSEVESASRVEVDFPIQGNFGLIKRILRKLTYFMIKRLFNEQNQFNSTQCDVNRQLRNFVSEVSAERENQRNESVLLYELMRKVERQAADIYQLKQRLSEVNKRCE
jgi:hypothetical protein